jgi:RNA polymerase sigma factor (sigma-70 family)
VEPFATVVERHAAAVWRTCRALLPAHDAEDAAGDALLAALEAYPRLRPGSDVRAWLVTVAHRKAIDRLRASMRARRLAPRVAVAAAAGAGDGVPDERLGPALASLPFKQRMAVAFHHLGGVPHAEVAARLGTTPAAARRAAADGVASLRRRLRQEKRP